MSQTFREALGGRMNYLSWVSVALQFTFGFVMWWAFRFLGHKDSALQAAKAALVYGITTVVCFWIVEAVKVRKKSRKDLATIVGESA